MPIGAARAEGPPVPVLQAAHLRVRDVAEPARHADAGVQAQDLPGSLGGAEPDAGLVEVVELLRLARPPRVWSLRRLPWPCRCTGDPGDRYGGRRADLRRAGRVVAPRLGPRPHQSRTR